jgi:hypothetical protein
MGKNVAALAHEAPGSEVENDSPVTLTGLTTN